jgi:PEP-CTERM motif
MRVERFLKAAVFVCLVVGITSTLSASPITYNVNLSIGTGGVTGTIVTNGVTGVLGAANITSWNLVLSDGTNTFNLTTLNSGVFFGGSDVTATATDLFFNFSGTGNSGIGFGDYLLFETAFGGGQHYYCNSAEATGLCLQGESVAPLTTTTLRSAAETGNQIIGIAAVTGATPEPATFVLFGAGVGAVALARRFYRKSARP